VRAFVDERIRPDIARWYETATFPRELVKEMGALGLLGMHLHGYGCAGRSAVEYGLAAMELEAGDSGLRTFVSVQGSLAMSAIFKFGSEEQKLRWLPGMAAGDLIGCFGLTEPTAGSDRSACTILGGNGLTLEHPPLRHASNLEGVRTYEGTEEVHTLIMGRAITGIRAFS
jgi:glutaryl-CoA dehydrogenase